MRSEASDGDGGTGVGDWVWSEHPELHSPFKFKPRAVTRRIIVHESHTPASVRRAVHLLRAQGRANGLLEVGYHYVIERDGFLTETRPVSRMGSHAPGCNHDSVGICMAADKDWVWEEHFEQVMTLRRVFHHLILNYGPDLIVQGHDEAMRRKDLTHKCPSFSMGMVRARFDQEKANLGD